MYGKKEEYVSNKFFLIIIFGIALFVSYSKFSVINPFSMASGLIQIILTDRDM